jgi:hypothetical protein
VEYATDLVFRSTTTLGPLYERLVPRSVLNVKTEQVVTFLGRQITQLLAQEISRSSPPGSRAPASSTASAGSLCFNLVDTEPERHHRWLIATGRGHYEWHDWQIRRSIMRIAREYS